MATADRFTRPSVIAGCTDYHLVCDPDGFEQIARDTQDDGNEKSWTGGMDKKAALAALHDGHQPIVSASERFMSEFEDASFVSRRWRTVDAVAGGAANVGAYLAGSPMAMRRRERQLSDVAPLTVLCDIISSASIAARHLEKRASAVLALVRVLGAMRPITVYAVAGMGFVEDSKDSAFCTIKIDTPLDLSRAAFMLGHAGFARRLVYPVIHHKIAPRYCHGNWPLGGQQSQPYRQNGARVFAAALGADPEQCLYLPPPHTNDAEITNPAQWLKTMIAQYGGSPTDQTD